MSVKRIFIKYNGKFFDFVEDDPDNPPHSGVRVRVHPGDKIKWISRRKDIDLNPYDGFGVQFAGGTPTPNKNTYTSSKDSPAADHKADSDIVGPVLGRYKYGVGLSGPGTPHVDPEIEVVDPGIGYPLLRTCSIDWNEADKRLVCPDEEVVADDLLRFRLEVEGSESVPFTVSFPEGAPVYMPSNQAESLSNPTGMNVTFYCQVRPALALTSLTYLVEVRGISTKGKIFVRPRTA